MACIRKELLLDARPEDVWSAVRDFGAPHEKLVPGVLVDSRLEPGARVVTFANGLVVRELLVELNDETRRLCWTARGGRTLVLHGPSRAVAGFPDLEGWLATDWAVKVSPGVVADFDARTVELV